MPDFWPSSGAAFSQLPRWPMASLSVSSAKTAPLAKVKRNARNHRLVARFIVSSSCRADFDKLYGAAPDGRGGPLGPKKKAAQFVRPSRTLAEESMLSAGGASRPTL